MPNTTAPDPRTQVRPMLHIPPPPFETERTLLVQTAHAWRGTLQRPEPRWGLPAVLATLALSATLALAVTLHHHQTPPPATAAAQAVQP